MNLPEGQLLRRRVLKELATALTNALELELTGYARLEPQDTLLLDSDGVGVITFENGIPVAVFHTGTDTGGSEALTDIGSSGPYRLELYELDEAMLERIHGSDSLCVPPGMPAKQLTGNAELVERTRDRAPTERIEPDASPTQHLDAVESFLDDGSKIEAIRKRARTEAQSRAEEWDFSTERQT